MPNLRQITVSVAGSLLLLLVGGCSQQNDAAAVSVKADARRSSGSAAKLSGAADLAAEAPSSGSNLPASFLEPVMLESESGPVSVEAPGYACPCWADVDGDGKKDLLVGQFNGGKIRVYKNESSASDVNAIKLAGGEWLRAGGDVAEVPGVW